MLYQKRSQSLLFAYGACVTLGTLVILSHVISSSSEPGSAILFGLSAPRLVMAVGLLFILGMYGAITVRAVVNRGWAEQFLAKWFDGNSVSVIIAWVSGCGIGLGWIGYFLPTYRTGSLENYWSRIHPAMAFILIISAATWAMFIIVRHNLSFRTINISSLKLGLPIFVPCLILMGWMFYSGFGVNPAGAFEDFWYGAGVPILSSQLIVAILGGIFILHLESLRPLKRIDLLICILVYALTAYLWAREPLRQSFMFTGPMQPNGEFYPFADSASFDLASQFPLIGEKFLILKSIFFERPLYLSFLVYLHIATGQNYERMMAVQAGVFAILPVLIYLIGRSLNIRSVGLGAALIATFRGINSIAASNMIDLANPKMILTDFPTAIGIALVVLFLCEWLNAPVQKQHYSIWIGGAIGMTLMLRTNALIFLVFVPLYIFIMLVRDRKHWFISSCLIVLGAITITIPWEFRNLSLGGQMYGSITTKFENVIRQRYPSLFQQKTLLLQKNDSKVAMIKTAQLILTIVQHQKTVERQPGKACDTVVCFSANHFLHNTLTSILILPTSPTLDDLRYLIRDRYPYYWNADWDGKFTDTSPLFLAFNLFLIVTGISVAWKEKQLAGLAPLAIFIAYNISNGLARTSGGRYIVPADWIIPIYYILGVNCIITWLANMTSMQWNILSKASEEVSREQGQANQFLKTFLVIMILFGIGWLIPLSENLYPPRYQNIDPQAILESNQGLIKNAGLKIEELNAFLQRPGASFIVGRALYPRFYKMNQGVLFPSLVYPSIALEFPRTAFKVIGPTEDFSVILPGDVHQYFPQASDVLVLGCNGSDYLDAVLVIMLDENNVLYKREPASPLQCPLQQPVCSNNSVCQ